MQKYNIQFRSLSMTVYNKCKSVRVVMLHSRLEKSSFPAAWANMSVLPRSHTDESLCLLSYLEN